MNKLFATIKTFVKNSETKFESITSAITDKLVAWILEDRSRNRTFTSRNITNALFLMWFAVLVSFFCIFAKYLFYVILGKMSILFSISFILMPFIGYFGTIFVRILCHKVINKFDINNLK